MEGWEPTVDPLIHTVLDFNLAQNNVGVQVNAGKKVTPTDPMPMGVKVQS